ncbi:MAG: DUF362 domain-containing protein [Deltaproteobacteria bacterium]|nr:DUF362 domain-containing protein [Deltaproteobacteria bacterium]
MQLPQIGFIRQLHEEDSVSDTQAHVTQQLTDSRLLEPVKAGDSVLLTAGSRGIDCMVDLLSACVRAVREKGGKPIIFPSMGSHGRGEAEGQVKVLEHLGITEETVGAPVYGRMEMVQIGTVHDNVPVYTDKVVVEADHVLVINRVKEHTEYIGETESGILKMAVVGLGRHLGAESMHQLAVNITYQKSITAIAKVLFDKLNILGALAMLENHSNALRRVVPIPKGDIFDKEAELLQEAMRYKPKLPFEELDILIVDEIGKEISGTGVDTKVIGRIMNIYERDCETPRITRVIIRDLTEKTEGNAVGIGLADFTTQRAVDKIDFEALNTNCITAVTPEKGRIPITLKTDKAAIEAALKTIGLWTPESVRIAWVSNSVSLEWLAVSKKLTDSVRGRGDISIQEDLFEFPFDPDDNLPRLAQILPDFS